MNRRLMASLVALAIGSMHLVALAQTNAQLREMDSAARSPSASDAVPLERVVVRDHRDTRDRGNSEDHRRDGDKNDKSMKDKVKDKVQQEIKDKVKDKAKDKIEKEKQKIKDRVEKEKDKLKDKINDAIGDFF